jgi:hypothetical protein
VQPLEQAEHRRVVARLDADAPVAHVQRRRRAAAELAHLHLGRRPAVLHRVRDEVREHLDQPLAVGAHHRERPGGAHPGPARGDRGGEPLARVGQRRVRVHGRQLQVEAADARVFEQRVDQPAEPRGQAADGVQPRQPVGVQRLAGVVLGHHRRVVVDPAQRLLEVVRGDVGEVVEFAVAPLERAVERGQLVGARATGVDHRPAQRRAASTSARRHGRDRPRTSSSHAANDPRGESRATPSAPTRTGFVRGSPPQRSVCAACGRNQST